MTDGQLRATQPKERVTEPGDRLLRMSEAGALLSLSVGSVRVWLARGYLQEVKLPSGQRRIPQSQVEAILRGER